MNSFLNSALSRQIVQKGFTAGRTLQYNSACLCALFLSYALPHVVKTVSVLNSSGVYI